MMSVGTQNSQVRRGMTVNTKKMVQQIESCVRLIGN